MKRPKRLPPNFRFALDHPLIGGSVLREVLPFQRSWMLIVIVAAMLTAFSIPAIFAFDMASSSWIKLESLMDLVMAIFLSAWLLGWSLVPIGLSLVLFVVLFGREVLIASPDRIEIGLGVPGLLFLVPVDPKRVSNVRLETPDKKSGTSWRGTHIALNEGATQIDFGSAIDQTRMEEIKYKLQAATGITFPDNIITDDVVTVTDSQPKSFPKTSDPLEQISEKHEKTEAIVQSISVVSGSSILLILANLIPVIGWWFMEWRLADVMVLYWAESAVIGIFNVCKMATINKVGGVFQGVFFIAHYSGFMAVHFLFIYSLFVQGFEPDGTGDSLTEVAEMMSYLWPAIIGLLISHGYSFFRNFLGRKEYIGRTLKQQVTEPYSRIIFMHVTLIFGGGLAMMLGDVVPVILLVILLKIVLDIKAHLKQRVNYKPTLQ
ncbi:DUF6498-containing protein [Pontibacter sp. JAM-7]|uniref:DUF6498-containing protein n=1 Tax=Pontibacter sp. JAM-7 TaxID=3366581 RepID=UPI003AF5077A